MTPVSKETRDSERYPDVGSERHLDAGFTGALSMHSYSPKGPLRTELLSPGPEEVPSS